MVTIFFSHYKYLINLSSLNSFFSSPKTFNIFGWLLQNMSRKDRRVNFSPEVNTMPMSDFLKRSVSYRASSSPGRSRKRAAAVAAAGGIWSSFRLQPKDSKYYSPMGFLRSLRAKVAKAIRSMSNKRRSSGKVSASSSSLSSNLTRCRSVSDPMDSHRAEALEDCIEFLNSSASLKRTNSVSSNY
ncbi:uncharacterized protein LOC133801151 [Humulus lupulus]|uniref:uncharacterized protein LOC133801151 n=1 Tax=Humulus lupulus TaxID=3486 RepID=UPI002B40EC87|nr:uncharacterized protein LOC133801151 [Humulus lupulus]